MRKITKISDLLLDDYDFIKSNIQNKRILNILEFTETQITIILEDNMIISFTNLEDELVIDIR